MGLLNTIKPSTYILSIIVFTFIILSGISLMGELRKSDPTYMAGEDVAQFNSTFNTYAELEGSIGSLQASVTNAQNDWGILGVVGALMGGAWNGLVLLFNSLNFMNLVFLGLGVFGVPSWVGGLMSFVVIVIIAFAIWSAVFRSEI
jgi:hypothetical protein